MDTMRKVLERPQEWLEQQTEHYSISKASNSQNKNSLTIW